MKPTIGRIVVYVLTESDKQKLLTSGSTNPNNGALSAPAIVVRAWNDTCVNLKVMADGEGTLWVTSALLGEEPQQAGRWYWPERA